jgi:hypothetical protein
MQGGIFKGVKVLSNVEGKPVTQYIILQENINDEYINKKLGLSFKGQFGLISLDENNNLTEMYIGSGHNLSFKKETLEADNKSHAAYLKY